MKYINKLSFVFSMFIMSSNAVFATVYMDIDAEDYDCESTLPTNIFNTSKSQYQGKTACDLSPDGSKHIRFTTEDNQYHAYTEVRTSNFPITDIEGKTFYLAYYFNFTRIDGKDIWDVNANSSADKGIEIVGNGMRWLVSRGRWGTFSNYAPNHYVLWAGNPSYHIDTSIEVNDSIPPNVNGYSASNPVQVRYDQWHSLVLAVKVSSTTTGSVTVYVNGVKSFEYLNTQTAAFANPTIDEVHMNGTIAQPHDNAPAHHRMFDKLLLTDDWQDIIDAGFIKQQSLPPELFKN